MKKLYAFALASGLALLGACSNDEPLDYDPTPIDEEGNIGYLRIEFPETATRAATGATTTADEANIEEAYFVFSYKDGTYRDAVVHKTKQEGDKAYWVGDHDGQTGNRCAIIKLSKMPQSVAVIVNDGFDYTASDLNQTSGASNTYQYKGTDGKTYFRMSSPRYYAGSSHTLSNQTPITGEMLFKDESNAANADGAGTSLKIGVEHYVAKVNIKAEYTDKLKDGALNPFESKTDKGVNNATISFKPEYTFLTAYPQSTQRIKKLDNWTDLATELQNWSGINSSTERWSGICRKTTEQAVKWHTLGEIQGGTIPLGHESVAYNADQDIYAFDNNDNNYAHKTSVVVVGKYTVTKNGAPYHDGNGTFWLVAFEDKFEVYNSETAALEAMGGAAGDVLIPEEVVDDQNPNVPGASSNRWNKWTGWMKIAGKDLVTRCVKFDKGYGYYAEPIYTFDNGTIKHRYVTRNHFYNVKIKGIAGMGVGIPDPNYPIIPVLPPDPTEQNYYLHMSIDVKPWRPIDNNVTWE